MQLFLEALDDRVDKKLTMTAIKRDVQHAVSEMRDSYEETSSTSAPVASSTPRQAALANVFRDIDE
jgi:hypothetical protein